MPAGRCIFVGRTYLLLPGSKQKNLDGEANKYVHIAIVHGRHSLENKIQEFPIQLGVYGNEEVPLKQEQPQKSRTLGHPYPVTSHPPQ